MIWCIKTYIIAYVKIQKNEDILSSMSNLQPKWCLKINDDPDHWYIYTFLGFTVLWFIYAITGPHWFSYTHQPQSWNHGVPPAICPPHYKPGMRLCWEGPGLGGDGVGYLWNKPANEHLTWNRILRKYSEEIIGYWQILMCGMRMVLRAHYTERLWGLRMSSVIHLKTKNCHDAYFLSLMAPITKKVGILTTLAC